MSPRRPMPAGLVAVTATIPHAAGDHRLTQPPGNGYKVWMIVLTA